MRRRSSGERKSHQVLREEPKESTQTESKPQDEFDFKPFILAIGLRIVAHVFLFDYLIKSSEFTTPWNSVERLKEAVHITNEYGISAYKGDNFHLMPVILKVLGPFTAFPVIYHGIFIALDIFAAFLMVLLVFVYPYYIVLMAPLLVAATSRKLITMSVIFASTGSIFAVNCLIENARHWLPNTFYFFWSIKDLTPNVGLFWYLFVFIFEQYRLLFQWCFQLISVVSMIPLTITLKQDPVLLIFGSLAHVAVLSTYPSYSEATVLLAIYPLFPHILNYTRNTLISFGTIVAALVLSPIMWRMWMITGSGNANFYFAITVVYTFALNFMATDVFYGLSRMNFVETCKEEGIEEPEKIPLGFKGVTPFITDPKKLVS